MSDRYSTRYGVARPRSPIYNHARASLPINLAYPELNQGHQGHHHHLHVVPASRREVPAPRSSNSSITATGGTITTTYKVTSDPPVRGNSTVREGSRTRRSTLDNHNRPMVPAIVTTTATPRHRPVVHSAGVMRAPSPMKEIYRSPQEEYIVTPASSRHSSSSHGGHHHHKQRYSMTMDNTELDRISQDHGRLRIAPIGRGPVSTNTRSRPVQSDALVRRDNVAEEYGDDGFVFTNPQDLVRYDLNNSQPPPQQTRPRRGSIDDRGPNRPSSVNGYHEAARSYDTRERGPPPSMRGFDRIHGRTPSWDQGRSDQGQQNGLRVTAPMPPQPPQPPQAPMMPVADHYQRPSSAVFEPTEQSLRRNGSNRARPTSLYQDRDPRRASRDERYEVREEESRNPRPHRERYDDGVEDRGFGLRPERIERPRSRLDRPDGDYNDRIERPHSRIERSERYDRNERPERSERSERPEKERSMRPEKEERSKGRDVLATGISLASAALGINAVKNAVRGDRDDRDDREEREEKERRRERREERESIDLSGRDPKERRRRDSNSPTSSRDMQAPSSRDAQASSSRDIPQERENKNRSPAEVEPDRAPRERQTSKDDRDRDIEAERRAPRERQPSKDGRDRDVEAERRERHRHRAEAALSGAAGVDSGSNSSEKEDATVVPRTMRRKRESGAAGFNPKDAMDLKALKDQLNAQAPKVPAKEPVRASTSQDDIQPERRSREAPAPLTDAQQQSQSRVVSPPRSPTNDKPVKGILKQAKEKFPEDPAPIREGVAPLKDSKKSGIPPEARWTKINRKMVNPEALELGKERFEARDDFVIVLRVLTREEIQGYAEVTSRLRQQREDREDEERAERRRRRRERHEEQKREKERNGGQSKPENERERGERKHRRRERDSESSTDSEDNDRVSDRPLMLEGAKKTVTLDEALMSGGLGGEIQRERVEIPRRGEEGRREER